MKQRGPQSRCGKLEQPSAPRGWWPGQKDIQEHYRRIAGGDALWLGSSLAGGALGRDIMRKSGPAGEAAATAIGAFGPATAVRAWQRIHEQHSAEDLATLLQTAPHEAGRYQAMAQMVGSGRAAQQFRIDHGLPQPEHPNEQHGYWLGRTPWRHLAGGADDVARAALGVLHTSSLSRSLFNKRADPAGEFEVDPSIAADEAADDPLWPPYIATHEDRPGHARRRRTLGEEKVAMAAAATRLRQGSPEHPVSHESKLTQRIKHGDREIGRATSSKLHSQQLTPDVRHKMKPHLFADPKHDKYPVDTPERASAAYKYFSRSRNHDKYAPEERMAIARRIVAANRRFHQPVNEIGFHHRLKAAAAVIEATLRKMASNAGEDAAGAGLGAGLGLAALETTPGRRYQRTFVNALHGDEARRILRPLGRSGAKQAVREIEQDTVRDMGRGTARALGAGALVGAGAVAGAHLLRERSQRLHAS